MEQKDFIELLKKRGRSKIVSDTMHGRYALQDTKKYLGTMDFGCDFVDGLCRSRRNNPSSNPNSAYMRMCCCMQCSYEIGYIVIAFKNEIPKYAKHFNKDTGFWREGKGCILPYKMRSTVCVTHFCSIKDDTSRRFIVAMHDLLDRLENSMYHEW